MSWLYSSNRSQRNAPSSSGTTTPWQLRMGQNSSSRQQQNPLNQLSGAWNRLTNGSLDQEPTKSTGIPQSTLDKQLDEAIARSLQEAEEQNHKQHQQDAELAAKLQQDCSSLSNTPNMPRDSPYPSGASSQLNIPLDLSTLKKHPSLTQRQNSNSSSWWGKMIQSLDSNVMSTTPKCYICGQHIGGRFAASTMLAYDPFWRVPYCPHHSATNTQLCSQCGQYIPHNEQLIEFPDGRSTCATCLDTAIMHNADVVPVINDVLAFYIGHDMDISPKPPAYLVDQDTMADQSNTLRGRSGSEGPMFHVRGLCRLQGETSVGSALRAGWRGVGSLWRDGPQSVLRQQHVVAIMVLYGLPRLLTGSVIAHELMHGWLRCRGVVNLSNKCEEGLCQLMAHLWLTSQDPKELGGTEKQLRDYFLYSIEHDISVVYGDGFREAYSAYKRFGIRRVLSHVEQYRKLPST